MADRDGIRRVARFLGLPGPASRWTDDFAEPAGFLAGLWHGFVLPLSGLVHVFAPDAVAVYEARNGGGAYRLGFWLGIVIEINISIALN